MLLDDYTMEHGDFLVSNRTVIQEVKLLSLNYFSDCQHIMFVVFLIIYLVTVTGNSFIISAIRLNIQLHTPMYFFLSNLSFLDICYTSITVPNILSCILRGSNSISFTGCFVQLGLFTLCASTECILLAAMACDRYVAICHPLHYKVAINRTVCFYLSALAWLCGSFNSIINTTAAFNLDFCGPNAIESLYCEVQPIIHLACSDTHLIDILDSIGGAVFGISCLVFILASYFFILVAIFRMPSKSSRQKTFSTCTSHMTVVALYFGALSFMYILPHDASSQTMDSIISMIYAIMTPMLNPVIYSLRNQQIIGALMNIVLGFPKTM
ncbi:olfactory receptor 8D4-like [Gastrophryne carolinensis]